MFNKEYMEYSREEMLKALQASILYLLPQAEDLDSVPEHDLDVLISTPIKLGFRLHELCDYHSNILNDSKVDRLEWTFRESVRR
ncbi:hypothetical protein EDB80DRAFT_841828 [Ilyonectria destructans]|nr:hypothetical protein EDB80DRAFT_841828 [Ilyonectria destructans]